MSDAETASSNIPAAATSTSSSPSPLTEGDASTRPVAQPTAAVEETIGLWQCVCAESNLHSATEWACHTCQHSYCCFCWEIMAFKQKKIQSCVGPARRQLTFCSTKCKKNFFDAAPTLEENGGVTRAHQRIESRPGLPVQDRPDGLCVFHYKGKCTYPDDSCFGGVHIDKAYLMSKQQLFTAVALKTHIYRFILPCPELFVTAPEHEKVAKPLPAEFLVLNYCNDPACCRKGHDVMQYLAFNPMLVRCPGFASCRRLITRHARIARCIPCAAKKKEEEEEVTDACDEDCPSSHADSGLTADWFDDSLGRIRCKTCKGEGGGCEAENALKQLRSSHHWDDATLHKASDALHAYKEKEGIAADDNSFICLTCSHVVSSHGQFLGYLPSLEVAKAYYRQVEVKGEALRRITSSAGSDSTHTKEMKGFSKDDTMGAPRKDDRARTAYEKVGMFAQPVLLRKTTQSTESTEEQPATSASAAAPVAAGDDAGVDSEPDMEPEASDASPHDAYPESDDDGGSLSVPSEHGPEQLKEFAPDLQIPSHDSVTLQLFTNYRPPRKGQRGPQFAVLARGLRLPVLGPSDTSMYQAAVRDAEKALSDALKVRFPGTTKANVEGIMKYMPEARAATGAVAIVDEERSVAKERKSSDGLDKRKAKKDADRAAGKAVNNKKKGKASSASSNQSLEPSPTAITIYTDDLDAVRAFVQQYCRVRPDDFAFLPTRNTFTREGRHVDRLEALAKEGLRKAVLASQASAAAAATQPTPARSTASSSSCGGAGVPPLQPQQSTESLYAFLKPSAAASTPEGEDDFM